MRAITGEGIQTAKGLLTSEQVEQAEDALESIYKIVTQNDTVKPENVRDIDQLLKDFDAIIPVNKGAYLLQHMQNPYGHYKYRMGIIEYVKDLLVVHSRAAKNGKIVLAGEDWDAMYQALDCQIDVRSLVFELFLRLLRYTYILLLVVSGGGQQRVRENYEVLGCHREPCRW